LEPSSRKGVPVCTEKKEVTPFDRKESETAQSLEGGTLFFDQRTRIPVFLLGKTTQPDDLAQGEEFAVLKRKARWKQGAEGQVRSGKKLSQLYSSEEKEYSERS